MKTNLDTIFITRQRLRMLIGICPHELVDTQDVYITLELYVDTQEAAKSDEIEHAVNYADIHDGLISKIETTRFGLLEKMAQAIVDLCFENELVQGCKVRIDKPDALRYAESVGIEITRWKDA